MLLELVAYANQDLYWMFGLALFCLGLAVYLLCLLLANYYWSLSSLPIFYCELFATRFTFRYQYILRLSYRDFLVPLKHHANCRLCVILNYGFKYKKKIPFCINKIYLYNNKLTSMVLVRSVEPMADILTANLKLCCSPHCYFYKNPNRQLSQSSYSSSSSTLQQAQASSSAPKLNANSSSPNVSTGTSKNIVEIDSLQSLQITGLSVQKIWDSNLIEVKLTTSITPNNKNPSVPVTGGTEIQNLDQCLLITKEDFPYPFAVERPEVVDYDIIRSSVCCPSNSYILFNMCATYQIFWLVLLMQMRLWHRFLYDQVTLLILLSICASFNAVIFFLSTQYIFVIWIQESLFIRNMGEGTWSRLGYYGTLLLVFVVSLVCGYMSIVTVPSNPVNLKLNGTLSVTSGTHLNTTNPMPSPSNDRFAMIWMGGSGLATLIFFCVQIVISYLDGRYRLLNYVFYGQLDTSCQVCVESYNTLSVLTNENSDKVRVHAPVANDSRTTMKLPPMGPSTSAAIAGSSSSLRVAAAPATGQSRPQTPSTSNTMTTASRRPPHSTSSKHSSHPPQSNKWEK